MHRPPPPSHIPQPRLTPSSYTPAQQPARITISSRVNWSSISRDLTITFLGVLLALAANNAWQDRRDHASERAELERLLPAARENELRVSQAVQEDSITEVRAQRTADVMVSSGLMPPLDSLVRSLSAASRVPTWRPVTGAFMAFAQAGGLRQIGNAELRQRIASYQRALDATAEVFVRMDPLAFENRLHMDRLLPPIPQDAAQASQVAESLRSNQELRRVLLDGRSLAGHRAGLLRRLRDETAALRKALENELQVTPITSDPAKD